MRKVCSFYARSLSFPLVLSPRAVYGNSTTRTVCVAELFLHTLTNGVILLGTLRE
eukprot:m.174278 g.174278  ORF g.174278 m.174278 type:complete len:55 (-) comp53298_c3_seq1:2875-3039(-)